MFGSDWTIQLFPLLLSMVSSLEKFIVDQLYGRLARSVQSRVQRYLLKPEATTEIGIHMDVECFSPNKPFFPFARSWEGRF